MWHHVALVFDSSISKYLFYFNGVLCQTFNSVTVQNYSRNTCWIGRSLWSSDAMAQEFINDFRLYDCTYLISVEIVITQNTTTTIFYFHLC